jgi:hypothetical protein
VKLFTKVPSDRYLVLQYGEETDGIDFLTPHA